MKTVLELSRELNVTPQAIYKKINSLKDRLDGQIHKGEKGETLINTEGQNIIKQNFKLVQQSSSTVNQQVDEQVHQRNSLVDEQLIILLNSQLEIKDRQIENLTIELKQANEHNREISLTLAELNRNNQILLKQIQERLPLPSGEETGEGFLKKFFLILRSKK